MYAPIAETEIPEIVALMNRAYRGNTGTGWSTEEAYLEGDRTTEALLKDDLARKPKAWILKWEDEQQGGIIGSVWVEMLTDSDWYLGSLAIDPARQNSGLGRTMLEAAEDWARKRGAKRMRMPVINVREGLIAWYMRRGYERTGEIEPFPYDDDRFGRPLGDDLSFVVLEKDLLPPSRPPPFL